MKSKQLKKTKKIKYKKRKTLKKKQKGRGNSSSKMSSKDYSSKPVLPDTEKDKFNIDAIVAEHVKKNPNDFSSFSAKLEDGITFSPTNNKESIPYKKRFPELYKLAEQTKQSNEAFLRVGKQKVAIPKSFDILDPTSAKEQPPNFGGKKKKGK